MPRFGAGGLEGWRVRNMNIYVKRERGRSSPSSYIAPGPIILNV